MVTGVLDQDANTVSLFIDGVLSASLSYSAGDTVTESGAPLEIGNRFVQTYIPPNAHFSGALDDINIFSGALTLGEITTLEAAALPEPATIHAPCRRQLRRRVDKTFEIKAFHDNLALHSFCTGRRLYHLLTARMGKSAVNIKSGNNTMPKITTQSAFVLIEVAIAPMSDCCMMSDSCPIRPKLGV
mgnify:CR=1 FL=1